MTTGPLARFKVIDLTRVRAGPTCVRQLADWGADVIKIESPEGDAGLGGERHGPDFQNLHRNKRSLTLNLKAPDGVEVMKRLVKQADVVVENYRPDVKFRLGVDYESLKAINPRIVYASISGFGQDGPYRDRPGFDQIAQGMGGLMSITGEPGRGPMRVGIPVADLTAGIFAAMGILIALLEREQSGEGQWITSSLLGAQISMLDFQAARWTIAKEVPGQAGNNHPTSIPTGVFATADGHINIAAAGDDIYRRLCKALNADQLAAAPAYATGRARSENRDALNAAIEAITRTRTSAEWIDALNKQGVPCGPIYSMDQVFADPQVKHLGMTRVVTHPVLGDVEVVGQPIELSRTPWSIRSATPEPGEHTDAILAELGYSAAEIGRLHAGKVV
ncbi:CaiB/BaiF CoA transferase family protein [Rhodopila sp.]|jgi:formyl-CoA transferase|uniref:CaiB/BaiF CoA transferase family protein n=1 Tax=Rhodopila sp. TaxID=2480087 RepID=UPI002D0079C0|nr:CoA transferase [Rhodopila sp.]HVZ07153.1 CoA transferase [Rhodopila sp.]